MPSIEVSEAAWPISRVHEAMVVLGLGARYLNSPPELELVGQSPSAGTATDRWIMRAAESLGLDAEPTSIIYDETRAALSRIGPALVPIDEDERWWLAIASANRKNVRVVGPSGDSIKLSIDMVRDTIAAKTDSEGDELIEPVLRVAGLSGVIGGRVRQELRHQIRSQRRIRRALMLRPHPGAKWWVILRTARIFRPLAVLLCSHVLGTLMLVLTWMALGSGALQGRTDPGWLIAAALLGLSQVPLSSLGTLAKGEFSLEGARVLKQRLLHGALRIDREETSREGVGHLMARVMESEAIESLALDGGLGAALASLEIVAAVAILIACQAWWVLFVLVLVVGLSGITLRRLAIKRRTWTDARLGLTHDLIERMIGHRTRITQEDPSRWHDTEDQALARTTALARESDDAEVTHRTLGRIFTALAVAALMPLWISGADSLRLAACVGGVLLAQGALKKLAAGIEQLVGAAISASRIEPLLRAATTRPVTGDPTLSVLPATANGAPVVELRGASLRYEGRLEPALRDANIQIWAGDRILCSGPSGGGKSSLAKLLAAFRAPTSGLALSDGLDLGSLGEEEWRTRVVLVPQFHENYIFVSSLAFNLLMGVQWPPEDEDLARAEAVCRALDLGPLIDRMPAGLMQPVGDSGWQLSHGERSRVFLARALLCRNARVLVLDESFGALDPSTLERCMQVTLHDAPALLIIAHP